MNTQIEFIKFPSLENTYRQKEIDKIEMMGIKGEWIVTEKVHGANFSFWVTKDDEGNVNIRCAKRTGWIEESEKFFNYKAVLDKYKDNLVNLRKSILSDYVLYGELFGGNIQSGMCYSEEQDFIAFDMCFLNEDGTKYPIEKKAVMTLEPDYNIPVVPLIGVYDTLQEALEVNESFDSLLMRDEFNGDDKHKEAEGIVIEPNTPTFEPNGSRIYLKKKTKRFLEKSGKPTIKHKQVSNLSPVVKEVLERSTPYICENRFNAVVSKIGEVTIKDIGKVMGLMTQDIIVDIEKDLDIVIDQMFENKPDKQSYMKNLQKHVQDFIKPILLSK